MAERASVVERTQIGLETTPGTLVAASKALRATSIRLQPKGEVDEFRPEGYKDTTLVTPVADWAEAAIDGRLTFDEFAYLLSAHYGLPTSRAITDQSSAAVTGAFGYEWTAAPTTLDTPKTLTVERGSAFRAMRAGSGVVKDLGYSIQRRGGGPSVNGAMLLQAIQDAVTLTASPTEVASNPVLAPKVDVYLDPTAATIGTTKLARAPKVEWKRSGKWDGLWVLDSSLSSWATPIEKAPDPMLTLTLQSDASGMALLNNFRAGSTVYVRIQAAGPQIATVTTSWKIGTGTPIVSTSVTHLFRHDLACKVREPAPIEDTDGVMGGAWPLRVVYDSTLGFAERLTLVNTLAAL